MLKSLLTSVAAALVSCAAAAVPASASPAPWSANAMTIDVVSANGSGCPWGTAAASVSPDSTAFTVTYSQFTAQTGVGAAPIDFRKNCQLLLNVHVPQGYTYAISSIEYRGYAHLERGAYGSQFSSYYFQGEPQTTRVRHDFSGYTDSDWQRTDTVGVSSLSYLPCGEQRYLNVNTELRVSGGWSDTRHTTSMLTMDSTDGALDTLYHVAWRKC
jgi:hypothetical protein